jgi:hypothetical protein
MSRIDRALVSSEWLQLWGQQSLWVMQRSVSDHCPIILRCGDFDKGPRPFRFNNHWLQNDGFKKIVEDSWHEQQVEGWMGYIMKERLKGLKTCIKAWNKEVYAGIDLKINKLLEDIEELDVRSELGILSEEEAGNRKHCFRLLWHFLKSKESVLMQRAGVRWLREGDSNSAFFHACKKSRGSRNFINALKVNGSWVESPSSIRQAEVTYFSNLFRPQFWARPRLDGILFPCLSVVGNMLLSCPFSQEEIDQVVVECDGNKSPDPDEFNFAFIKAFWYLMKGDVKLMFDQFFVNASLPKSFSSFFVALIPKVKSPFGLNEFRLISLLGCLYKLVAKVLAARLARVRNSIVASTQSAFLKGRLLVDGVLVVNEVVDLAKKS